ncbi:MAG: hypothetical protein ACJAT9_000879 [Polaribacter sp.]|jgi:hypothetical protein
MKEYEELKKELKKLNFCISHRIRIKTGQKLRI